MNNPHPLYTEMLTTIALSLAVLAVSPPAHSRELAIGTTCNLRYNNRGIIHGGVPCRAGFTRGRISSVTFVFPTNQVRYSWRVGQPGVTADPRWAECLRHTSAAGNQWQACTIPSPQELGLSGARVPVPLPLPPLP